MTSLGMRSRVVQLGLVMLALSLGLAQTGEAAAPVRKAAPRSVASSRKPVSKTVTSAKKPVPAVNYNLQFTNLLQQGKTAYSAENFTGAETALQKCLSLAEKRMVLFTPENYPKAVAAISNLLGLAEFQLKKYPAARLALNKAITLASRPDIAATQQSSLVYAHYTLGQMAMFDGDYDGARNEFQTMLSLAEPIPAAGQAALFESARSTLMDIDHIGADPDYRHAIGARVTHWNRAEAPILVYIESGSKFPDWKPTHEALLRSAFGEWQAALENRVRYEFVNNPQQADMVVNWVNQPFEGIDPATGKTELRHGICRVETVGLNLTQNNLTLALHDQKGKAFSENSLYNTSLHEIAHSIGLIHGHSTNPSDVLFPSNRYEDGRRKHLTARDINTARLLYAMPAQITDPPNIHLVQYAQFARLRAEANQAYNGGNYTLAQTGFTQALSVYNQDADLRFWLAMCAWKLNQKDQSIPDFMAAASMPGAYQGSALRMTGVALIQSAQQDDQAGLSAQADEKYRRAYQLLQQSAPRVTLKPDDAKSVQEQLSWLSQRLAMRSANLIQWDGNHSVSSNPAPSGSETEPGKKKKRSWFFEPSSYSSKVPVMMTMPGHMMGY